MIPHIITRPIRGLDLDRFDCGGGIRFYHLRVWIFFVGFGNGGGPWGAARKPWFYVGLR